jgi:hypothetical protein
VAARQRQSDFGTAKAWLTTLHERVPNDHHIVHRLALAT